MADDSDSIFAKAGFQLPKAASKATPEAPAPKPAAKPVASESRSIFESAGFTLPDTSSKPAAVPSESVYPTPEGWAKSVAEYGVNNHPPKAQFEVPNPGELLKAGTINAGHDILENAAAGWSTLKHAFSKEGGDYLPSLGEPVSKDVVITSPVGETRTTQNVYPNARPGRLLEGVGGALGVLSSPVTGATNALVTQPITELTGNPDIGDRAGVVANALLPIKTGGRIAHEVSADTRGVNALVKAIGPENVPEVVAGMRANPRMTPADLSDPVRLTTQGLMAGGTPEVQDFIAKTVRDRGATRLEAANTAFTQAMGPAPDVPAMVEGLKDRARKAGREAIAPALSGAKAVDVSPVIAAIDKEVQPGIQGLKSGLPLSPRQEELWRLRNQLVDAETGEQMFDAAKLHEIQSRNGDLAYQLQKSPDGKTRHIGNGLRDVNEKLVDAIDTASGGSYRPARAKFKDAKEISEAFESGFDTLKNRAGLDGALADSPAAFKKWMDDASPEEVVARRLGTRADIDRRINGVKNGALAGETVTAIPYNREKLTMLFGEPEAKRLIRVMGDSTREAQTSAAITAGSKTAETTAAKERIQTRKVGGGNPLSIVAPIAAEMLGQSAGIPFLGLAASVAGKGVQTGAQKLLQMSDISRNRQFARNALAAGAGRESTIDAMLSHPKVISELKKRTNALTTP